MFYVIPLSAGHLQKESHKGTMLTHMSSEQNDLPSTQVLWQLSLLEMQEDQRSEVPGLCDLESELLVPSPLDPAAQTPTPVHPAWLFLASPL